ncbi:delta 9-fatty acid desaturase protein [Gloeopeniophorella convolvens]|nr:delta 9-fatty acid desaturase protein [Gloeopeniophorella convolvens]
MPATTGAGKKLRAPSRVEGDHKPKTEYIPRVRWFNLLVEASLPLVTLYGAYTTTLTGETLLFCIVLYVLNMLGYHRLWAHRSYNASPVLQYFLAITGGAAIQGSIRWWARGHRAHHRYTDTDLDPYGAHHGFWYTHIGWMLLDPLVKPGAADISDLKNNAVVTWQHRRYFQVALLFGFVIPASIPGYLWGDWRGGFFYACFARLLFVHHSVFSVNSVAHYFGETTYDDKLSPRDHFFTAYSPSFPMDYRNATKWYQYDPTKWFIAMCSIAGLASHLKVFPSGEIKKGELTMQLKRLKREQDALTKPPDPACLPVISWDSYQQQSGQRALVLIGGFIHDHVAAYLGKDATTIFMGGVYSHSNAAHNLLSGMRVGVLHGGSQHVSDEASTQPSCRAPWQRWEILFEVAELGQR